MARKVKTYDSRFYQVMEQIMDLFRAKGGSVLLKKRDLRTQFPNTHHTTITRILMVLVKEDYLLIKKREVAQHGFETNWGTEYYYNADEMDQVDDEYTLRRNWVWMNILIKKGDELLSDYHDFDEAARQISSCETLEEMRQVKTKQIKQVPPLIERELENFLKSFDPYIIKLAKKYKKADRVKSNVLGPLTSRRAELKELFKAWVRKYLSYIKSIPDMIDFFSDWPEKKWNSLSFDILDKLIKKDAPLYVVKELLKIFPISSNP